MKNLHASPLHYVGKIVLSLLLLFPYSCQDPLEDGLAIDDPDGYQGIEQWQDLLPDLVYEKSMIVQQKGSIQAAIDAANPGEAIYIEAGVYKEAITIEKTDIKLIGIAGANGEQVILENPGGAEKGIHVSKQATGVEVRNIQLKNFADNTTYADSESSSRSRTNYFNMSREEVGSNIAHYQFDVRLGQGEFDIVRIHRVVKETRMYRPIRTKGEVFMNHGGSQDFDDIFYTAGAINNVNPQTSSPVYLASRGIDVWGIDLGWTKVPVETTDFNFMQGWGVEKDVDHTLAAMSLARLIRGLTGQGFGKLNLLGFSYGAFIAYTAAGHETQKHELLRNIKGIIPVDGGMKYEPTPENEAFIITACNKADVAWAHINGGTYQTDNSAFHVIGNLATNAPDQPSPIIPGLTNYQVPLFFGSTIYEVNPPQAPYWHFVAGNANELFYTDEERYIAIFKVLAPYQPRLTNYNVAACLCDKEDVSIDDYLDQIVVPIFYLGAGGGLGTYGDYSTSLTASTDITHYTVSLLENPCAEDRAIDFGHADLFMADNAPKEVWGVLWQWLVNHNAEYLP